MTEKLADLQTLREELVERRREEANRLSAHSDEGIKMLGHLHLAIEALDAVIEVEPPNVTTDCRKINGRGFDDMLTPTAR